MFGDRGVSGTSLDDLAGEMGVTKQTILYHFRSKDGLLAATLESGAHELLASLEVAVAQSEPGWDRIDGIVRATFALAVQRPDLIGLLREVSRLGEVHRAALLAILKPVVDSAVEALAEGMDDGVFRRADPRLVLLATYSLVTGVVADPVALLAVGLELDLRVAVALRGAVLDFLRAALLN